MIDIDELLKKWECCTMHANEVRGQIAPALRQQQAEIERVKTQLTNEILELKHEQPQTESHDG
jgi:hypothetical protein